MKPHFFQPELAIYYGLAEATFLQDVAYLCGAAKDDSQNYYEGRYWVFHSYKGWQKAHPYWSEQAIRRLINKLIGCGALLQRKVKDSDTYAYSLSDELLYFFEHNHFETSPFRGGVESDTGGVEIEKKGVESDIEGCRNRHGYTYFNSNRDINRDNRDIYSPAKDFAVPCVREDGDSSSPCSCDETTEASGQNPEKVTNERRRRTSEKSKCLFANSRYFDKEKFFAEFTEADRNAIDLNYYYNSVADWSAAKGKMMKDWIATARNFIRKDVEIGKLHKKKNEYGLTQDDTGEIEFMMRGWKQRNQ